MRDIVATVQREQDEIIRGPLPGILVVQGGPGTGKTAVALHRAAYLLYTYRFPLEGQGVLVVGPNPTFLRYIEHVLPSLDESGVELSTVNGLFSGARPVGREEDDIARLKGDARMARVLARAVADRERPLRRTVEVAFGPRVLRITPEISAQVVATSKRRPGPAQPPPPDSRGPPLAGARSSRSHPAASRHRRPGWRPASRSPPRTSAGPSAASRRSSPPWSACGRC